MIQGGGRASALLSMMLLAACNPLGSPGSQKERHAAAGEGVRAAERSSVAEPPPGLVPGKDDKILTITSDDPGVQITGVFLDGKPLKTAGLGKTSVRALLVADPQDGGSTPCDSDGMELRLANGVIYRPQVDFCASHDLIRAAARLSRPSQIAPSTEGFVWQTDDGAGDKALSYGVVTADATSFTPHFTATCHQGTTRVRLTVPAGAGDRPRIDVYAPDRVLRYDLRRVGEGAAGGAVSGQVDLSIANQLFILLMQGKPLAYRISQGEVGMIDTAAGADRINAFVQWCQGG